jgi:quercetin dioxygenase-like cupin family protein
MRNPLKVVALLLLSASVATLITGEIGAQQQPSSPTSAQTIKRTPLRKVDVPGANYEVVFAMVEIPSNVKVGRHSHPGTVFAYLLEGDYKLHIDGQPAKEYKAGETFEIAPGVIHDELTGEKAAKALVVFTVEKGKPLASPAQ